MPRILIVEDDPAIAIALEDDLRLEGYGVEVVHDGESASRRAREAAFDLILLDVMLPKKDGFEVCRELRRAGVGSAILLLTARPGVGEGARAGSGRG
jgi:DNA-binding response OmpR family regulator